MLTKFEINFIEAHLLDGTKTLVKCSMFELVRSVRRIPSYLLRRGRWIGNELPIPVGA